MALHQGRRQKSLLNNLQKQYNIIATQHADTQIQIQLNLFDTNYSSNKKRSL